MPETTLFEYEGSPIEIVGGAPYEAGLGIIDIPMFENFDPNNSVKHFRFKFHATQDATDSLFYFKIEFYNSDMEDPDSFWAGTKIAIQDGWIGDVGESWGSGPEPENRTTFVSDHAHYGTVEGDFTPPDYVEVYEAADGGSSWVTAVIDKATKKDRLPAGGDWFLRITLSEDSPGDVTLHDFSFEVTCQEYKPRNLVGPIPLTEGWVCSNTTPSPTELYLILHRGMAYMYGEMLDWSNFNEETDEAWFSNLYDDATTKLVDVGGIPEEARPASRTIVPIRFYDFERSSGVLGKYWGLSINTDGSITFVDRPGQRPDKLRLGGGDYSFAPMQVNWPLADRTHAPDIGVGSDVTWEVHNEFLNEGETAGQTWEWDSPISLTKHGGITHLRGAVHHEASEIYDTPLWESGGVLDFALTHGFDAVKVLLDTPGAGQDFGFIQQLSLEIPDVPAGSVVQFDGSLSTGSEPLAYAWDFGDGESGTGISPSHTYEEGGTYFVTLTVTDPRDRSDSVTKRPRGSSDESYAGSSNAWASYVNDNAATMNSTGGHVLFLSGDPVTQVFTGETMDSGTIPNAPGDHFIGADVIDQYFDADKNFLGGGLRHTSVDISSAQMPYETASVIGRKYGTAVCIQPDGSHYRHEVECIAIPGGGHPNTYRHKLYKNVGGTDTQLGSTHDNDDPICLVSAQISFTDVEQIFWAYASIGGEATISNNDVPKSGKWGFFVSSGVALNRVAVNGNAFPSYPEAGVIVGFDIWWPSEYEFDEFTPSDP